MNRFFFIFIYIKSIYWGIYTLLAFSFLSLVTSILLQFNNSYLLHFIYYMHNRRVHLLFSSVVHCWVYNQVSKTVLIRKRNTCTYSNQICHAQYTHTLNTRSHTTMLTHMHTINQLQCKHTYKHTLRCAHAHTHTLQTSLTISQQYTNQLVY